MLVKEVQKDIITDTIKHIDFFEIERGKTLRTTVPIQIEGSAAGVKEGGLLEEHLHSLEIECMPKDIPTFIPLDVSSLNIGDSLHVSDLKAPEGVKILSSLEVAIVRRDSREIRRGLRKPWKKKTLLPKKKQRRNSCLLVGLGESRC